MGSPFFVPFSQSGHFFGRIPAWAITRFRRLRALFGMAADDTKTTLERRQVPFNDMKRHRSILSQFPVTGMTYTLLQAIQSKGVLGGEGGIRTLGRALRPYDGLANRCFRPLSHLSAV